MRVHRHCAPGNDVAVFRHLATAEAARLRLRPILMTSFAFTLGVLPLVIAKGPGIGPMPYFPPATNTCGL